jgi:ABC-type branched-subunit amino acid transport system ATPase component/ABC-type branched-subunit amino acid transport system permease subunit
VSAVLAGYRRVMTAYRKNIVLIAIACVALPIATAHAMPRIFPASWAVTLSFGVSLAIAALAVNLLLGYAGQLSLGHAALLGVGAYASGRIVDSGAPMFVGLVAAVVAGAIFALVIGLPALRLRGIYLALVTIAFGLTMQASVLRWNVLSHGAGGVPLPRRLLGNKSITDDSIYLSICLLLLLGIWLLDRNVVRTKVGRAFRMIREDEDAAQSFGIDVTRYKLLAFVLSGGIAGLAGGAYGHAIGLVNSDVFTLDLSLRLVLFVIIGGIGSRWGIALVAVLFSLSGKLPHLVRDYDLVVAAVIVLYNVIRLPGGLGGLIAGRRVHRRVRREADESEGIEPALALRLIQTLREAKSARTHDEALLRVENVSVRFGGLIAVDDASLRVEAGRIVGVIGPNGAGKSTLFNAISGFVQISSGRMYVDGAAIHDLPAHARTKQGIGRTFQLGGLAGDMSVRENLELAQHLSFTYGDARALLYTKSVADQEERVAVAAEDLIHGIGLETLADALVRELSGGQQRLVEIAAVLATSPKVLLLDEPAAGLSPAAAEALAEALRVLRDEHGQTVVLVEHNVPLVLDVCDHVYVLNAGAVLAEGPPRSLRRNPEVLSTYLGKLVG